MRTLLVLTALVVAALAQQPPHILLTPQTYAVDGNAKFSLTSYTDESFNVDATVSYQTCRCISRGFLRCTGENVFSKDTQLAEQGRSTVLNVQMPSLNELHGRRYSIAITSHDGENVYHSRLLSFSGNSFGFVLVKTDKPIYKPSQTVNICVVYLDRTLRPHSADAEMEVIIRDARYRQVLKTTRTVTAGEGVECFDILLADEPNLGRWSATAMLKLESDVDGCRVYYKLPSSSCNFKVEEFVLPKFEVTLEGPKQITRNDKTIEGTVSARYTFGENVQGTVKINATLEAGGRRESLRFFETTVELVKGEYSFNISSEDYRRKVLYRYDPFCVKSFVHVFAEVTEAGREDKQSDSIRVPLVANPISVSFDKNNPTVFRAGLPYTIKGKATRADGSPATGVGVVLTATANNGGTTLLDAEEILTDSESGTFSKTIAIPEDINCLKFTLSPLESVRSCESQSVCFSPSPMYSPTKSFLQLTDTSSSSPLKPGQTASVFAEATFFFKTLHLVVVGQGNVLLHKDSVDAGGAAVKSLNASFQVGQAGVPGVKVLGVVAREDGELVADLIEIAVNCELEHEVSVSFRDSEASPGDMMSITARGSPDSMVVLGVIDKSLTLLADACKSLSTSNVCRLLKGLTGGYKPGSAPCSTDSDSSCCPSFCSEPTKRAVADMFRAAGLTWNTNMFQPNPPFIRQPPPSFPDGPFFADDIAAFRPLAPEQPVPEATIPPPTSGPEVEDGDEDTSESADIRDFFPETWIWEIFRTNESGVAVIKSEVPDTITTWNAEAFAISGNTGLGISSLAELIVKKELFVSLELPFSIIFSETVTVTPLVFYFGDKPQIVVRIQVAVDDDLDIMENQLPASGLVRVEQGSGTPFTLKLRPRAIGHLSITICARPITRSGQSNIVDPPCADIVRKNLFVKPGCERFQITENVYASDSGRQCFNYSLPSCVIPGSAKARISVTGDVMTPPDLDRLLVLPTGCGEQNMVKFSLNVVVGHYLASTGQLSDLLTVKIRNNLLTGYQRQLTFLQGEGCFSIWPHGECSLWLTAFTTSVLIVTSDPMLAPSLGFAEGSQLVDVVVIRGALNYLIRQQEESGRFPVIGRVHNYYLLSKDDFIGLTAFTLITLKIAKRIPNVAPIVEASISRSEQYILQEFNNRSRTGFCNYGLALATTAVTFQKDSENLPREVQDMVTELKSRIITSKRYPGACFVCNECPNDEEEEETTAECPSRPRGEGSAACVETTAYTLHAMLNINDNEYSFCLAQWLVQVKSASGGFYSSQDTLLALDSLARFAQMTFTKQLNKTIMFSEPGLSVSPYTITPDNRFETKVVEIPSVPSTNSCVQWSGIGTAILQSTLEYYGCSCCDDTQSFSLQLSSRKTAGALSTVVELTIIVGYLRTGTSNMAIVDVEVPSGYVYTGYKIAVGDNPIQREERRGANAIFYLNEVSTVQFVVSFEEQFTVENHQQLPVTVYDYYNPDQIVTKYYLPITSGPIVTPPSPPPAGTSPPITRPTGSLRPE